MAQEGLKPIERWAVKRRGALTAIILKGEVPVPEAAREHDPLVSGNCSPISLHPFGRSYADLSHSCKLPAIIGSHKENFLAE